MSTISFLESCILEAVSRTIRSTVSQGPPVLCPFTLLRGCARFPLAECRLVQQNIKPANHAGWRVSREITLREGRELRVGERVLPFLGHFLLLVGGTKGQAKGGSALKANGSMER